MGLMEKERSRTKCVTQLPKKERRTKRNVFTACMITKKERKKERGTKERTKRVFCGMTAFQKL